MKTQRNPWKSGIRSGLLLLMAVTGAVPAADVPAALPDPDGQPGDATKPVRVYILAGQSNMVGMGDISGARNMYDGMFFTADPAAPKGPLGIFKVGNFLVGPLKVFGPDGQRTTEPVAEGTLEVGRKGVYRVQCGSGSSSYNTMEVDGRTVYQRDGGTEAARREIALEPGRRYLFKVSGFEGEAPRFWLEKTDLLGSGDLETVVKREGMFPWLVDDQGGWTVRQDVYFQEARVAKDGRGEPLTATSNGKAIGPELGFGHVMGEFHDAQVLLIKTAMGNRSLGFDFRPPSSGRTDPDSEWESAEYRLMIEGVHNTLEHIDQLVPGYRGQGYELAGFVWWQGHKDSFDETTIADYEKNLVNLIRDVRNEFKTPKLPAVVATVGFGGHHMVEKFKRIFDAQMAVGDPQKHPEFAGTVAAVDIRDFWREIDESPRSQDYHYNRNAETYMRVGDALGRAMIRLEGGMAETLPQRARPEADEVPAADRELTEAEQKAARRALAPIVLDGIAASYIADPRHAKALHEEARQQRPQRANPFLRGAIFGLVNCYEQAGIDAYGWHAFGPDLRDAEWRYFSFDPAEKPAKEVGPRYRKVTWPAGMENWVATDFDAAKAGWKTGLPPFGSLGGELEPLGSCERGGECGCGEKPRTLWDKEMLLIRTNCKMPPLRDGYRYRIVIGGSNHVNGGEGYAIYADGQRIAESNSGVGKRQGGQPRGAHIYQDLRELFDGREVTLAVTSFLRSEKAGKPVPPQGHLTVWIEEQKIPEDLLGMKLPVPE